MYSMWRSCTENWKACSANQKVSAKEAEGFFQRALGSYTHTFPKHSAALLMDLLELGFRKCTPFLLMHTYCFYRLNNCSCFHPSLAIDYIYMYDVDVYTYQNA